MYIFKKQFFPSVFLERSLPLIILFGLCARLSQYLFNRSLWLDEAMLALHIVRNDFISAISSSTSAQSAPAGFILIEKLLVLWFGDGELILRFFPLLCACASIFLFYCVVRNRCGSVGRFVCLSLFAVSGPLIYYASECKVYSCDVLCGILLVFFGDLLKRFPASRPIRFICALSGVVLPYFSYTSVFILGSWFAALLYSFWSEKQMRWYLVFVFFLWSIHGMVLYFFLFNKIITNTLIMQYWQKEFPSIIFSLRLYFTWIVDHFVNAFHSVLGLEAHQLGVFAFLVGGAKILYKSKYEALFFLLPIVSVFAFSFLRIYPFHGRLILFLAPFLILGIGYGVECFFRVLEPKGKIIGAIFVFCVLFHPFILAGYHLVKPRVVEEIKPLLAVLQKERRENDFVYIYYSSQYAWRYYSSRYKVLGCTVGAYGRDDPSRYIADLEKLRGKKRVWFLFSHLCTWCPLNEELFFRGWLTQHGREIVRFRSPGAWLLLYDLSN